MGFMKLWQGGADGDGASKARHVHTPVYWRWWFWVLVVLLAASAWYAKGYVEWWGDTAGLRLRAAQQEAAWKAIQAEGAYWTAQYKADTYGGETPEETLELFIEALEAGDYELASRYFVPEKQRVVFEELIPMAIESGSKDAMIDAFYNGRYEKNYFESVNKYEIDLFPFGETIGFSFEMIQNEYSKKWKIIER
jgi:hypothetical protein